MVPGSSRTRSSRAGWSASAWTSTSNGVNGRLASAGRPLVNSQLPTPNSQLPKPRAQSLEPDVAAALQGRPLQTDRSAVANCANCGAPMKADRQTGVLACKHCGSTEQLAGIA